jgi:hypothetical protein
MSDNGHWHATAHVDLGRSEPRGYAEALCGTRLLYVRA